MSRGHEKVLVDQFSLFKTYRTPLPVSITGSTEPSYLFLRVPGLTPANASRGLCSSFLGSWSSTVKVLIRIHASNPSPVNPPKMMKKTMISPFHVYTLLTKNRCWYQAQSVLEWCRGSNNKKIRIKMWRIKIINPIVTTMRTDVIFIHPLSHNEPPHIFSKGKAPTILNVSKRLLNNLIET